MKHAVSLILAAACIVLACALIWDGATRAKNPPNPPDAPLVTFSHATDLMLLDKSVGNLRMENVPLEDAIRTLAERTTVNISVDWPLLDRLEVSQKYQVDANIVDGSLGDALDLIIKGVTTANGGKIGYYVADGIITITSETEADRHPFTGYLNVRPLIEEVLINANVEANARQVAGSPPYTTFDREDAIEYISKLVTDLVAADSWRDQGGTVGSIREIGGVFIVSQTPSNLRATRALLERFHRAIHTVDFPPDAAHPSAQQSVATQQSLTAGNDDSKHLIAYFNVSPIIAELLERAPDRPVSAVDPRADAVQRIEAFIMSTVDTDSWRDTGGVDGSLHEIGGVLVVAQTPANVQAVRTSLKNLQAAILRDDFVPATRPTRKESE